MEEKFDFENYFWTEHISRKLALWGNDPEEMLKTRRTVVSKSDFARNKKSGLLKWLGMEIIFWWKMPV